MNVRAVGVSLAAAVLLVACGDTNDPGRGTTSATATATSLSAQPTVTVASVGDADCWRDLSAGLPDQSLPVSEWASLSPERSWRIAATALLNHPASFVAETVWTEPGAGFPSQYTTDGSIHTTCIEINGLQAEVRSDGVILSFLVPAQLWESDELKDLKREVDDDPSLIDGRGWKSVPCQSVTRYLPEACRSDVFDSVDIPSWTLSDHQPQINDDALSWPSVYSARLTSVGGAEARELQVDDHLGSNNAAAGSDETPAVYTFSTRGEPYLLAFTPNVGSGTAAGYWLLSYWGQDLDLVMP